MPLSKANPLLGIIASAVTGSASAPVFTTTGDTNTGIFFPAADTIALSEGGAEAMRIDSSGNTLIGTLTSPSGSKKFVIRNAGTNNPENTLSSGSWVQAVVAVEPATYYCSNAVSATGTAGSTQSAKAGIGFEYLSSVNPTDFIVGIIGTPTVLSPVKIFNGTERMRITSGGNVGIGTATPTSELEIFNDSGSGKLSLSRDAGIQRGVLRFGRNNGGSFQETATITGFSQSASPNNGLIAYSSSNSSGVITERLRIDSSGNVGIGTDSPSAQLELSTDSAKKPSTNTWTIASDERLKTNITTADNDRCYEIVKQVALKRYTWKGEVYSQDQVKDRSKLGWIAQDVESVFPKAVGTSRFVYNQIFEDVVTPELDSEGNAILDEQGVAKTKTEKRLVSEEVIEDCKDLNTDQIYAAMYGTIQKLIQKVETLEAKVVALEAT